MKASKGSITTFFGNNIWLWIEWVFLLPTCFVSFETASQPAFLFTAFCYLLCLPYFLSWVIFKSGTSPDLNFFLKFFYFRTGK